MNSDLAQSSPLERLLARVLHYGTWTASALIAAGLALAFADARLGTHNLAILPNIQIVTGGIALFILLPVLRVVLMLVVFLRERAYRLGGVAALVLAIIFLSVAVGISKRPKAGATSPAHAQGSVSPRARTSLAIIMRLKHDSSPWTT